MLRPRALTVLALLLLAVLSGCAGGPDTPGPPGPATALTLPPETSPSSTAAAPPGSDDASACAGGDCELRLTRETEIRLDPGLDADRIVVSDIEGNRARVTVESGGSTSTSSGGSVTIVRNDLSIRVTVEDGVALVRLSTS